MSKELKGGFLFVKCTSQLGGKKWRRRWVNLSTVPSVVNATRQARVDTWPDQPISKQDNRNRVTQILANIVCCKRIRSRQQKYAAAILTDAGKDHVFEFAGESEADVQGWIASFQSSFWPRDAPLNRPCVGQQAGTDEVSIIDDDTSSRLQLNGTFYVTVTRDVIKLHDVRDYLEKLVVQRSDVRGLCIETCGVDTDNVLTFSFNCGGTTEQLRLFCTSATGILHRLLNPSAPPPAADTVDGANHQFQPSSPLLETYQKPVASHRESVPFIFGNQELQSYEEPVIPNSESVPNCLDLADLQSYEEPITPYRTTAQLNSTYHRLSTEPEAVPRTSVYTESDVAMRKKQHIVLPACTTRSDWSGSVSSTASSYDSGVETSPPPLPPRRFSAFREGTPTQRDYRRTRVSNLSSSQIASLETFHGEAEEVYESIPDTSVLSLGLGKEDQHQRRKDLSKYLGLDTDSTESQNAPADPKSLVRNSSCAEVNELLEQLRLLSGPPPLPVKHRRSSRSHSDNVQFVGSPMGCKTTHNLIDL